MSSRNPQLIDAESPIGLHSAIETPENVVLTYRLAGPALRLWAYLIDFGLRLAVIVIALIGVNIAEFAIEGVPTGLWLVLLFLSEWWYAALMEGFFRGKTIGKHALNIRVIQEGGYPISFWSALLRNFVRAVDALPFYGIGFVTMLVSGKFRRIGDLVAGTVVIEERRVVLPREPIILEMIQPLQQNEIGSFVPQHETLTIIEEFLERRFILSHQRGHEMASQLATVLAKRLHYREEGKSVEDYPMAFLARVYVTFHQSLKSDDEEHVPTGASVPQPALAMEP